MGWLDYVPVVGSVVRAAQGDWKGAAEDATPWGHAAIEGGKYGYKKLYQEPADAKKAALDAAAAESQGLGQDIWGKAMAGKDEAMAQFAPADAAYQALYGDPKTWSKAKPPAGGVY